MKHLSVLPLLGSLLLVGCAVGTDNGAWQLSEQQGSRQQVSFNQEQVYRCSYPNGTYQLTYTTVSGDCGDVPIPLPKFMSGKDNLLALGEAVEIVNGGCYLQDHAATNDPSQCTANIDTVCLGGYANGLTYDIVEAIAMSSNQSGSALSGTIDVQYVDEESGRELCQGDYSFVAVSLFGATQ